MVKVWGRQVHPDFLIGKQIECICVGDRGEIQFIGSSGASCEWVPDRSGYWQSRFCEIRGVTGALGEIVIDVCEIEGPPPPPSVWKEAEPHRDCRWYQIDTTGEPLLIMYQCADALYGCTNFVCYSGMSIACVETLSTDWKAR